MSPRLLAQVPGAAAQTYTVLHRPWGTPAPQQEPPPGAWVVSCAAEERPEAGGALWRLSLSPTVLDGCAPGALGPDALRAVRDARASLRALPWGWSAIPVDQPQLVRVARYDANLGPAPTAQLDGRSLSLAAILLFAAEYYGVDLPEHLIASADLDPTSGTLRAVRGCAAKVATLAAVAPGVREIIVASAQVGEWAKAVASAEWEGEPPAVRGFATVQAAVDELLRPAARLGTLDAAAVRATYDHLCRVTLEEGMAAGVQWPAVAAALEAVAPRLPAGEQATLALLGAVAIRYQRGPAVPAGDAAQLTALVGIPNPRRRSLHLAHAIQNCAQAASPAVRAIEERLPPLDGAPLAHRVWGAWARWRLVVGPEEPEARARLAGAKHREIVEHLDSGDELHELSYSLADWLRLAGAVDPEAFGAAEAVLRRMQAAPDADPRDLVYAEIAHARGVWALGAHADAGARRQAHDRLKAIQGALKADTGDDGLYPGMGFLIEVAARTRVYFGEGNVPDTKDGGHLALYREEISVDAFFDRLPRAHRPTAEAVAGTGEEATRRRRILTLYPF